MAHYISQPRIEGPIWLEPSDISFLQTRIAETEKGVETLEEQISELTHEYEMLKHDQYDSQLSELIRIKDAKIVEISSLRNTLSPIRRIPVEILSEILELSCIPADGVFDARCDASHYASLVSSVCVAWRRTALADPRMWSTIYFCLEMYCEEEIVMWLKWLKEWVSRSQGHPLDLYLDLRFDRNLDQDNSKDKAEQVLECILDFSHQIRSIQVRSSTIPLPLFRLPRSSLPLLEEVLLSVFIPYMDNETRQLSLLPQGVEAFLGAPKLKHFVIDECGHTSIFDTLVLPHEQLASLELNLTNALPAIHQNTLCQCKNLVSFTTNLQPTFDRDFSICLPALKTLDITCWDVPHTYTNFLHGLTTPLLEHLTIRWCDQDIQGLCTDLLGLQSRSSATLSSLTLIMDNHYNDNTSAEDSVAHFSLVLAAFPTVRSLWLQANDTHLNQSPLNALIRSMICTRDRRPVLPNLTYFELCIYDESVYPPDIASMLSSRRCPYKPDVDDTNRVLQNIVARFQCDGEPTTGYIDIMENQCILP